MNDLLNASTKRRPPRLNHKKSKFGCFRCKARRVKCDEKHPVCSGCQRHEVPCVYQDAPDTPSGSLGSLPPASSFLSRREDEPRASIVEPAESKERRLEELRLIHEWTTTTAATIPSTDAPIVCKAWAVDAPLLALGHPPLLYAILAFAAFHLSVTEPRHALKHIATARRYFQLCIRYHNAALTLLSRENADVIALTCLLLSVLIFRDLDTLDSSRPPESSLVVANSLYQRLLISHSAGQRFREAWSWVKDDAHAVSTTIVKGSPVYRETGQLRVDPSDGRLTWPSEYGVLFKGLLDPSASQGPIESTLTDSGPMTEELWDVDIRGCYEEVLNHIGAIHTAIARKEEAPLTICRRLTAFPCLLPRKFFELLEGGRPRAMVILSHFFAAAKAVDSVWWVGDAGKREVHAIWESLDGRWKRQMGEALRIVHTGWD